MTDDLDAIWDNPASTPTPNVTTRRKCRRHEWIVCADVHGGEPCGTPPTCLRCGAVRNPVVSRTNRNNRKRGNRTSHDLAAYLGGRNVEALKLPWDVEACGARIQSKRLKVRPSIWEIVKLITYIDAGPNLRALYWVGAGQRVASGYIFVLLREWVAEHGWSSPASAVVITASPPTEFVLELPVAAFRDLRGVA